MKVPSVAFLFSSFSRDFVLLPPKLSVGELYSLQPRDWDKLKFGAGLKSHLTWSGIVLTWVGSGAGPYSDIRQALIEPKNSGLQIWGLSLDTSTDRTNRTSQKTHYPDQEPLLPGSVLILYLGNISPIQPIFEYRAGL